MSVEVKWDNADKTVIQMMFEGRWQWDDVRVAVLELNQMIESVDHQAVHLIANRGAAHWTPGNYVANAQAILELYHPRVGYRVAVVRNPLAREMFYVFSAMVGGVTFSYRFVNTLEEAREFLARYVLGRSNGN
jgi:hypothetical protein